MPSRRVMLRKCGRSAAIATAIVSVAVGAVACARGAATGASKAARPLGATTGSVTEPLPRSTLRRLPPGVFYMLWGVTGAEDNLWELSSRGLVERQLTHNPRGYEIDSFAASRAGIILSDALYNEDLLARWTTHGVQWMRPAGRKTGYVRGFDPDIRPNGQIAYLTPSNAIWLRRSFSAQPKIVYRYPKNYYPGSPTFGPHGQIAIVPPSYLAATQKPTVVIVSEAGTVRFLDTGYSRMGYPTAWGQTAAALVIPPFRGPEKLFFPDGSSEQLPGGWKALSWNPDGSKLLVISRTSLGMWSRSSPGRINIIGPVNRPPEVIQASWLNASARS